MINVPILQIPFDEDDRAFIHEGIEDILDSGFLTSGKWTERFENSFASFTDSKYCIAVNSGTAAIEVILRALGINNSSVIVPTNTFLATALAVVHSGNHVIFSDSDPETLSLTVDDVKRRITDDTRAVILVNIGGEISPEWQELKTLCEEKGLYLIEDCAHAHGCVIEGRHAGTLGVAGAFSFFPTKVFTSGEGGAIITDNEDVFVNSRMIRNQGKNPDLGNQISEMGHNFRMSEFGALIAEQQMKKSAEILSERRNAAAFYDQALLSLRGVTPVRIVGQSGYYKYVAYLDEWIDRDKLKVRLKEKYKVSLTGEVYSDLCHDEPVWDTYTFCGNVRESGTSVCSHVNCNEGYGEADFSGAKKIKQRHICLPIYPGLTDDQLSHVTSSLGNIVSELRTEDI